MASALLQRRVEEAATAAAGGAEAAAIDITITGYFSTFSFIFTSCEACIFVSLRRCTLEQSQ